MKLDLTFTTCNVPELIEPSIKTYKEHIKGIDKDSTMFVNIDNLPIDYSDIEKIKKIITDNRLCENVIFYTPETASFPKAIKRLWSGTKEQYICHIELDWLLERDVNLEDIKNKILYPTQVGVSLRHWRGVNRICLAATLFDGNFCRNAALKMPEDKDPENWLRNYYIYKNCRMYPFDNEDQIIKDIGTEWKIKNHINKNDPGNFTCWK